jgi:hypothetical protein
LSLNATFHNRVWRSGVETAGDALHRKYGAGDGHGKHINLPSCNIHLVPVATLFCCLPGIWVLAVRFTRLHLPYVTMKWKGPWSVVLLTALFSSWPCYGLNFGRESTPGFNLDVLGFSGAVTRRADPSLAGYLGVFFLGADPYMYFYLSNGNDPLSFKALNRGTPIVRPTKGTGGVRDPTIVPGGGSETGKRWYIIGTDLDIGKVG